LVVLNFGSGSVEASGGAGPKVDLFGGAAAGSGGTGLGGDAFGGGVNGGGGAPRVGICND
jgi:hypothetical protein